MAVLSVVTFQHPGQLLVGCKFSSAASLLCLSDMQLADLLSSSTKAVVMLMTHITRCITSVLEGMIC